MRISRLLTETGRYKNLKHCLLKNLTQFSQNLRNKMFSRECRKHLEEVDESGLKHMLTALKVAIKLQLLVPALIIHSVAPRFFTNTASDTMRNILKNR